MWVSINRAWFTRYIDLERFNVLLWCPVAMPTCMPTCMGGTMQQMTLHGSGSAPQVYDNDQSDTIYLYLVFIIDTHHIMVSGHDNWCCVQHQAIATIESGSWHSCSKYGTLC